MTDLSKNEQDDWALPVNFPSIEEIMDPSHEVNISSLIDATNVFAELDVHELAIVKNLDNRRGNSVFSHQEMNDYIAIFANSLSSHFRRLIHSFSSAESLYLSWSRVAADFNNTKGLSNLFKYAVGHQAELKFIKIWGEDTFNSHFEQFDRCFDNDEKKNLIQHLKEVVYMLAPVDPALSYKLTMKLISANDELTKSDSELNDYSNGLIKKIGGVRILEPLAEAADRTVQRTSEQYKPLTLAVTPVIKSPNLTLFKNTLDSEFPWFSDLTNRIYRQLLVRQLGDSVFFIPPTLILGPPGIGKTSYINRLSVLIGVPFKSLSLAGKTDNKDLTGTARGWSTGEPSAVINFINHKKIANPIFLLDEIDKAGGSDHNGRIYDTLLTLFEPSSSKRVYDEYLATHADLSYVSWLSSGNDVRQIPSTLLSRLDVVNVPSPAKIHYPKIVKTAIETFCQRNGINPAHIPSIEDADWRWLSKYYSSPRVARRATEKWLTYRLLHSAAVAH